MMVPSRSRNTARSKDLVTRRSQHLPRGREYITGANATHTGMVERALAEAARSAPGLVSQNRGSCLAAAGSWRSQAIPAAIQQRPAARSANIIGHIDLGRRQSVRKTEQTYELLVVLDLMDAGLRTFDGTGEQPCAPVGPISPSLTHACASNPQRGM